MKAWWRTDATGNVVLKVLYGARTISFAPGKDGIVVGKQERLVETLRSLIQIVEAGELDQILASMSKNAVLSKGKRAT